MVRRRRGHFGLGGGVAYGKHLIPHRIVRFLVVGAISTGFSYGIYAFMLFAGLNYAVANFAALAAGILFSFKSQGTFVFDNADNSLIWRFAGCWLLIYAANVLFIRFLIHHGFDGYTAGLLPVPAIAVLSYLVQRYFVFGRRESRDEAVRAAST